MFCSLKKVEIYRNIRKCGQNFWVAKEIPVVFSHNLTSPTSARSPHSISLYGSQFIWLVYSHLISSTDSQQAILDLGRWSHQQETIPDMLTQDRDWLKILKFHDVTSASDDSPDVRKPLLDNWFETSYSTMVMDQVEDWQLPDKAPLIGPQRSLNQNLST